MRNTTFNLPDDLLRHAKSYAALHGTSVTAIVRKHLESITGYNDLSRQGHDPLMDFSKGSISKEKAIKEAGLRDYSELLPALGQRNLPLPALPEKDLQRMTSEFIEVLKEHLR